MTKKSEVLRRLETMRTSFPQSREEQATHQYNSVSKKANNVKPISQLEMKFNRKVKLVEVIKNRDTTKSALKVK